MSEQANLPRLPVIALGTLSVSRLLVGGNPISGFSHQPGDRSARMTAFFTVECIKSLLRTCEHAGVTGLVARADPFIMRFLQEYWGEGGKIRWIAQTAPEHRDAVQNIRSAHRAGAAAIYLHGGEADRLIMSGEIETVRRLIGTMKETGLPTGMAGHVPESHRRAARAGLPLDFHMISLYNITGYRGQSGPAPEETFDHGDRPAALGLLMELEPPAILYKIYGAGRLQPQQAYRDLAGRIRPCDGVCVGMFPPDADDIVGENVRLTARMRP